MSWSEFEPLIVLVGITLLALLRFGRKTRKTFGSAAFATLWQICRRGMLARKGLRIGEFWGAPVYYNDDAPMLLVSPAGSMKGAGFIITNLLEFGLGRRRGSVLCNDPKGENAAVAGPYRERRGRKVVYINGWRQHGLPSHGYNPLDFIDPKSPDFADDCDLTAEMLVTRSAHETGNSSYFKNTAQEKLKALIGAAKTQEPPARQNLLTVREYVMADFDTRQDLWRRMKKSSHEFIRRSAVDFEQMFENAPEEFQAVLSSMREATTFLESEAMKSMLSRSDFNPDDLKNSDTDLFIITPAERLHTHAALPRLVMAGCMRALMKPPRARHKVWFCIDEAASLGAMGRLKEMMSLGRGYGIWAMPVFQDKAQIKGTYKDEAQSFFSNAKLQMFMAVQDFETAEYISKTLGVRTVATESKSENGGKSTGEASRPLLTPDEVIRLSSARELCLVGNMKPLLLGKRAYWDWPSLRGRAAPNPFHGSTPLPSVIALARSLCGLFVKPLAYLLTPHPLVAAVYIIAAALWFQPGVKIGEARAGSMLVCSYLSPVGTESVRRFPGQGCLWVRLGRPLEWRM